MLNDVNVEYIRDITFNQVRDITLELFHKNNRRRQGKAGFSMH